MFAPKGADERSLAEFAPAGANKVQLFFPMTCASEKIHLAERSVDRAAKRTDEARSAAHPLKLEPSEAGLV